LLLYFIEIGSYLATPLSDLMMKSFYKLIYLNTVTKKK